MSGSQSRCEVTLSLLCLAVIVIANWPPQYPCPSVSEQLADSPGISQRELCRPWIAWRPSPLAPPLTWTALGLLLVARISIVRWFPVKRSAVEWVRVRRAERVGFVSRAIARWGGG